MLIVTRREILVTSGVLIAGMATGVSHAQNTAQTLIPEPSRVAPEKAPSKINITDKNEPGEPLIVTGRVTGSDGKSIRGVSIFVYHTDASGKYDPAVSLSGGGNPRLRGYMRTDADGRYSFATIRPAPYPGGTIPAHIHYAIIPPGYSSLDLAFKEGALQEPEVVFSDDPQASNRRSHAVLINATKDARGTWHVKQNFVLAKR